MVIKNLDIDEYIIWLVVWNSFYFSIYWEWKTQLTDFFQRGSNHQPEYVANMFSMKLWSSVDEKTWWLEIEFMTTVMFDHVEIKRSIIKHANIVKHVSLTLEGWGCQNFRPRTDFEWFVCVHHLLQGNPILTHICLSWNGRSTDNAWTIKHSDINHWKI